MPIRLKVVFDADSRAHLLAAIEAFADEARLRPLDKPLAEEAALGTKDWSFIARTEGAPT